LEKELSSQSVKDRMKVSEKEQTERRMVSWMDVKRGVQTVG
jgi:hypothetical protein